MTAAAALHGTVSAAAYRRLREENEELLAEVARLKRRLLEEEDRELVVLCRDRLGLSAAMAVLLLALYRARSASKESLFEVYETAPRKAGRPPAGRDTDPLKVIDVQLSHIRKRITRHGIIIETLWGIGYRLTPDGKAIVGRMLGLDLRAAA
jgi:DNA-binding response OmpR family regulator